MVHIWSNNFGLLRYSLPKSNERNLKWKMTFLLKGLSFLFLVSFRGSVSFRDPTLNHRFHATAAKTPQKWWPKIEQIIATQNLQMEDVFKNWPMDANGILGYDMFSVFCCQFFGSFVVQIEGKNLESFPLFSQPIGTLKVKTGSKTEPLWPWFSLAGAEAFAWDG